MNKSDVSHLIVGPVWGDVLWWKEEKSPPLGRIQTHLLLIIRRSLDCCYNLRPKFLQHFQVKGSYHQVIISAWYLDKQNNPYDVIRVFYQLTWSLAMAAIMEMTNEIPEKQQI